MSRHATSSELRPITLQSVYNEIATVRELLERLLLPATSPRQWLTIAEATALAGGRTPQTLRAWCRGPYKIGVRTALGSTFSAREDDEDDEAAA
jgi:hypothetical protein